MVCAFLMPLCLLAASAKFHVDVGLNHFYKKRFLEAYREFKTAQEKDPKYAEAYYNLGRVYKAQGFIKEALMEFQNALRIKPDYIAARRELETLKSTLEQDVRAQLKLKGHDNLRQTEFNVLPAAEAEKRGRQLLNQGRANEAIRYFEQAFRQRSDDAGMAKMLGFLYFRQNRFDKALERYSRAMQLAPTDPEMPYSIGLIYMKTKMYEKAETSFRQALALRPDMVKAIFGLGESLEAQEKLEDAIFQFRKCLEINPDLEEAQNKLDYMVGQLSFNYFSRGSYFYQRGEYDKAESMLSLARTYGNLSEDQNRQIDEMLNASRFWLKKQQEQTRIASKMQQSRNSSYINKNIEVYDVSQNFKPYIGESVIWSGRIEFVGKRDGKKYLFINSRPERNLDSGMEHAFEIEFPDDLPDDPRVALGSEVAEVRGHILRVDKIRNQISGTFSTRRQPVIEASEIEITRKNYGQPLILRFY
jgi:tetratricopeptide (TPR) repeat protein